MATTTETRVRTIDYFESVYAKAGGDPAQIPWAEQQADSALVNWLNVVAPSIVRCGARVAVAGCGLGADAREIMRRGYEVTGFDCSETAVRWAQSLDPDHVEGYVQADLFQPPGRWIHRFDLVVEVNNLESLAPSQQREAVAALANLMTPHGRMLIICRASDEPLSDEDAAPWPVTEAELLEATALAGLVPDGPVCTFTDDDDPSVRRIRAMFRRQ